jgi:hypothetical protein
MYHNIQEQIPSWNRSMVRFTYLVELISIAAFFYNCLIVLIAIFARVGPGLNWWFISLLALVMGVPLSWWLFYKGVFNSAQTDGATYSYIRTFLTCMLHLAWCVWMILGVPNLGTFSAGEAAVLAGPKVAAAAAAGTDSGQMYRKSHRCGSQHTQQRPPRCAFVDPTHSAPSDEELSRVGCSV